jgi:hypothetical protein
MNRLLLVSLIPLMALFSCKKESQAPPPYSLPDSYYGQWQWIGSSWGPSYSVPSPDSTVVLILAPGNLYTITLNGTQTLQGSFQADSTPYTVTLQFNNITQPAGSNTSVTSGNVTELFFNYVQVGQFMLFQYDLTSCPGDTLQLVQSPIDPEAMGSYFKRVQGTL